MANEALIAAQEGADAGLSDQEISQQLTGVELDRFLKLQSTFESPGWSIIQEWCATKEVEAGVGGANAQSWEDNREQYGRRVAWQEAGNLDTAFMNEFEAIANQAIEDESTIEDDLGAE